jgi:predicted thioesterase
MTDHVPGPRATTTHQVTEADTARALGSGDLSVLATPRLLAWCEGACLAVLAAVPADDAVPAPGRAPRTSVGTRVELEHTRATPVGAAVEVRAELVHVDGRLLRFGVAAHDDAGRVLATGELTRVLVEAERFLARL